MSPATPESIATLGGNPDAIRAAAEATGIAAEFVEDQVKLTVLINGRAMPAQPIRMFRNMMTLVRLENDTEVTAGS